MPEPEDLPAHAKPTRRQALRAFLRPNKGQLVVGVVMFLTALLVVTTLRSQAHQPEFATMRQSDLIQLLDNQHAETRRLENEIRELEATRSQLLSGADRAQAAQEEAQRRLAQFQILSGTVPAVGPGITIEIHDPQSKVSADLLLNAIEELRDAGAEVIEINGQVRLVVTSWFADAPNGRIIVDDIELRPPYLLTVIGERGTLEAGARFRGGLVSQVESERVGGEVFIAQSDRLEILSVVPPASFEFATPVTGQ
ncbi:MAG TPA: DUF881 domain-containing protein [Arachnia sp.]|nr:DUF881 domain-containing protein [Arachnia sp.]HMT86222.1 DUF881 domain-containing protein [Arachnia sp.]